MTIIMYEGRKNVGLEEVKKLDQNLQEAKKGIQTINENLNKPKWCEKTSVQKIKEEISNGGVKLGDAIDLNPNFCGLGLNLKKLYEWISNKIKK